MPTPKLNVVVNVRRNGSTGKPVGAVEMIDGTIRVFDIWTVVEGERLLYTGANVDVTVDPDSDVRIARLRVIPTWAIGGCR